MSDGRRPERPTGVARFLIRLAAIACAALAQMPMHLSQIGVPDAHHPLSHHENKPDRVALMSKINTYHVKLVTDY